jgi:hypothetical protein
MQQELLQLPWPEAILQWGACAEERDPGGRLVWRGLRVRMGLAWGGATYRKPLNTGAAAMHSGGGMSARNCRSPAVAASAGHRFGGSELAAGMPAGPSHGKLKAGSCRRPLHC